MEVQKENLFVLLCKFVLDRDVEVDKVRNDSTEK